MSVITIDGPAGAGKSTVSKEFARRLAGYTYLDTGAMYRAIAWAAMERGVDLNDVEALADLCSNLDIELRGDRVFLDRRDISSLIRTTKMDSLASAVSQVSTVRESLTRSQREIGMQGNIVAEGRDMGTVVFPNADHKFFLTASPEERARRRKMQLEEQGEQVAYEDILLQINARDRADSTRPVSPLRPAPDSVRIDSSYLTIEEILEMIIAKVKG
jgi:cytidylate kinase